MEDWPHHVMIVSPLWHEASDWCSVHIGEFGVDWYKLGIDPGEIIISGQIRSHWYFKRESDCILFTLRWS